MKNGHETRQPETFDHQSPKKRPMRCADSVSLSSPPSLPVMVKKAPIKKATGDSGLPKMRGESFYRTKSQVKLQNMYKDRPVRDEKGKVVKAAAFASTKSSPIARVQPDRRWFGTDFHRVRATFRVLLIVSTRKYPCCRPERARAFPY